MSSRLELAAFVVAAACASVGCNHSPEDGEAIDEVCTADNHFQEVSASGYLKMIAGDTVCMNEGCPFLLSPHKGQAGTDVQKMRVYFRRGTGPRQIEVKKLDNPSKDDLIFRDDDGNTFQTGDVIRVTGKIAIAAGSQTNSCHMMRPTSIQKL